MAFPGERKDSWQQKELTGLMASMTTEQKVRVIVGTLIASLSLFDDPDVRTSVALDLAHGILGNPEQSKATKP